MTGNLLFRQTRATSSYFHQKIYSFITFGLQMVTLFHRWSMLSTKPRSWSGVHLVTWESVNFMLCLRNNLSMPSTIGRSYWQSFAYQPWKEEANGAPFWKGKLFKTRRMDFFCKIQLHCMWLNWPKHCAKSIFQTFCAKRNGQATPQTWTQSKIFGSSWN